jgi:tetratricopeptide (TPR) repeat protein/predicted Ser/Thr protein kinase
VLDDSLTAGSQLEQPTQPESPTDTVSDLDEDPAATRSNDREEHKHLGVGDRFAGFQVRGILGRGAMGVVYEAWDATLERRVALKLLRSPSRRAAERLLREARALARLDHPGVVRIWAADVHRGAVYIAMELIEGQNLREWMKSPRSWAEVLSVMIGAGRGLAAAHAAGVIHRDFKPENVLVGWDAQARVLDFGIARISSAHPDHLSYTSDGSGTRDGEATCAAEPLSGSFASLDAIDASDDQLTEVGSLIGTLLYMAPEQHARERADERSDQFGFCTTLFEALYGRHPFPARTIEQLAMRVSEGQISFPDDRAKIPRWLEKVIVRGLSPQREDRFPNMEALIDALERHPSRRRRRNRVLTVAAVALAAVTLGVMVPRKDAPDPCADVGHEIDEVLGDEARDRISARFAALDGRWAGELGERVDDALDGWTGRWVEARTEVCQSRHAHREATLLDRRREACLAAQLAQVGALGEVLTEAGSRTLTNTEHLLAALPDPGLCMGEEPPQGQPQLEGQEQLVAELAELYWLSLAEGGDSQTRTRAERLVEQARALPSEPHAQSLLADALIVLAHTQIVDGDLGLAEAHLREAGRTAERIEADGIRARAIVDLGWTLANTPSRADDAVIVLEDAAALLERTGNPGFERERHQQALGEALLASGDHQRARAVFEAMLVESNAAGNPQAKAFAHATTLMGLSRVASAEGKHASALEYAEQALAAAERKLGDNHPVLAAALTNIGQAHVELGNHEAARAALERSIALRRTQLQGESTAGNRSRLAEVLIDLANLDSMSGNGEAAANGYREALALVPESDYSNRALALFNLGVDHQIAGRSEQALANYQEALRLAERVHAMDSKQVVGARLGVGIMLVNLGRPAEARGPLERCEADWPPSMVDTADEGELRFGLARTLGILDGLSPRVESLVADASAIYLRQKMPSVVAEIDAWMTAERGKP